MNFLSTRISSFGKLSGLLSLFLVAGAVAGNAQTPLVGGGNPPMPPSFSSATVRTGVGSYFTSPWDYSTGNSRGTSFMDTPLVGGGNPPMPPGFMDTPLVGGGNPPMPPSLMDTPLVGGGNPPMPPSLMDTPLVGGGNPPMPPGLMEAPLVGGGNPPMPPSLMEAPLVGGGSPPMPPSVAVAAVVGGIAIYTDGTVGYPNGDFQFTSGAYLWADGFVRYSSAPGNFVWTNYAGVIINTTVGDVAANGLPHVEYPALVGLSVSH